MDNPDKNMRLAVICKLLYDALLLLLLVLAALLVAEALLPGFLSSRLSFLKVILLIFANLSLIFYLEKKLGLPRQIQEQKKPGKFFFAGPAVFFVLLVIISLLKFPWPVIVIITFLSLSVFYYLYKITIK